MTKPMVRIHDIATDEVIDREMTDVEYDAYLQNQKIEAEAQTKMENEAAAKISAENKLELLGLTPEEIAALRG